MVYLEKSKLIDLHYWHYYAELFTEQSYVWLNAMFIEHPVKIKLIISGFIKLNQESFYKIKYFYYSTLI